MIGHQLLWVEVDSTDGWGDPELPRDCPPGLRRLAARLCVDGQCCALCGTAVGHVTEDGDDGRMRTPFRPVTLVLNPDGGRGWALCEDCTCALDPAPEPGVMTDGLP